MESLFTLYNQVRGPTVTIFSGTHGNEISGILANTRLKQDLISGALTLIKGTLHLVLEVNKRAIDSGIRGIHDENIGGVLDMNRFFQDDPIKKDGYEYFRSRELMPLLQSSDYMLDLHSTSGPSEPYAFVENQSAVFASMLGIGYIVSGWGDIRGWKGEELLSSPLAGDIESYATRYGAIGITFESGNHNSPDGAENAYQVILNFLVQAGMLDSKNHKSIHNTCIGIHMTRVYRGAYNIFHYAFPIKSNFIPLEKGSLIGHDGNIAVMAPEDCIIVMPTLDKESIDTATGQKDKNIFQIGRYTHI